MRKYIIKTILDCFLNKFVGKVSGSPDINMGLLGMKGGGGGLLW